MVVAAGTVPLVVVGTGHMAVGYKVQRTVVENIGLELVGSDSSDNLGFGSGNLGSGSGFQGSGSDNLGSGFDSGNPGSGYAPECRFWAGLRGIYSFYFSWWVYHFLLSSGGHQVSRTFHYRRWGGWVAPSMDVI